MFEWKENTKFENLKIYDDSFSSPCLFHWSQRSSTKSEYVVVFWEYAPNHIFPHNFEIMVKHHFWQQIFQSFTWNTWQTVDARIKVSVADVENAFFRDFKTFTKALELAVDYVPLTAPLSSNMTGIKLTCPLLLSWSTMLNSCNVLYFLENGILQMVRWIITTKAWWCFEHPRNANNTAWYSSIESNSCLQQKVEIWPNRIYLILK